MTPSQALARSLQVVIKVRARAQEKSIHEILLHYAFTLSPFVESTAPGVCTIQFTDYRDLSPKLAQVIEQVAECEITAQAAIAPTADTSFLAAHLARPVLQIENAKEFLAPLTDRNSRNIFLGFLVGTSRRDVPTAQRTTPYQRFFFVFPIPSVCFTTNDFTRAYSFRTPLAKSRGPYSNSTTKQKVKTMKRANQKSPRSNAMEKE